MQVEADAPCRRKVTQDPASCRGGSGSAGASIQGDHCFLVGGGKVLPLGFIVITRGPGHVVEFVNDVHRRLFGSGAWAGKTIREACLATFGQGAEVPGAAEVE